MCTQKQNCCFHNPHHVYFFFPYKYIVSTNFVSLFFHCVLPASVVVNLLLYCRFQWASAAVALEGSKSRKGNNYYEPTDADTDDTENGISKRKGTLCTS